MIGILSRDGARLRGSMAGGRVSPSDLALPVFVYGTLRRGARHAMGRALALEAELLGDATVQGELYDLGEYPGAIPSRRPSDVVRGELLRPRNPDVALAALDAYEGCGASHDPPHDFERAVTDARLHDGRVLPAWIYWYRGSTGDARLVRSGDYLDRAAARAVRGRP